MPNREGGYGGYQSSQPQQNRMPRKVNAPGSGKVRRGVDPAGLGAQRPPQRPTRPAQQPPEPPPRRRTAERPAAQPQPVHRAAPRPQQRSAYHAQQPNRGNAPHPRLCCKPRLPDRRVILAGTAAGILLLAGVITLLLPSNKAVENVPVGTEQTAQAGRLVAPVPYADSDGSGDGGPSIDWGTIGPVQQAETYTYTAAPQAPDMVPEFGRVSTDWFSDAAFLGDSLTAGIAYYDINVGGALVLGYEGTSPNQSVNRTALKNTNEDDAEQVPLDILAEQQPAKQEDTPTLAGLHLLLAEDNELNSEIAVTLLEAEGAEVTAVTNGREAVEAIQHAAPHTYDAVLMDVMMPEMNGLEATRCIRAFEGVGPDEGTPIIAMTANVFADDVRACLESGMNSHVGKPLDMRILMREILKYTHRS